ncbi:MAG: efflux RND transporter periplasmic adaptor subunit [Alphaproteobacteria bacterium]|nr:efflux RND transporter periplasmic adaptor subunit [Alphaproteobacteria bacterium]
MSKQINKQKRSWVRRHKWLLIILTIVVVVLCLFVGDKKKAASKEFVTMDITRGNLSQTVTATGEIKPLNTVSVGSQVSGTIEELFVDYNSTVKKGDKLLTIEPSVLQASVVEAEASLESAKSQLSLAKSDYERNKTLYDSGYIARAEMEKSQSTYEQAVQSVKRMQSQYDKAVTNLGYATITSPVDGTVISRKVDKGQTVAASFQTPDLFEIAEDLTKMQIETSVSEADIGVIKTGQSVTFTVDAYPKKTFNGAVRQVRLSPTTTSSVVVYTVVIDVDNHDLNLMPGMTAFVTIIVNSAKDAWKAQNAAFLLRSFDGIVDVAGDVVKPSNHLAIKRGKDVVLVPYSKGITTATETQIVSDEIVEGDKIIVGYVGQKTARSSGGGQRGGGMGGPGMGGGPR